MSNLEKIRTIEQWLEFYHIVDYQINDDFSVDVKSGVNLSQTGLSSIPFQFNRVEGSFNISQCAFTTFENVGLPRIVDEFIAHKNQIQSLKGCPVCTQLHMVCNELQSLKYLPDECQLLDVSHNNISSLIDLPVVSQLTNIVLSSNPLTSLKGLPSGIKSLAATDCLLTDTLHIPQTVQDLTLVSNQITQLEALPSNLKICLISSNQLSSLEGLPVSVDYFDFSDNQVKNFEHFKNKAYCFSYLNCDFNPLESLDGIPPAKTLELNHCGLEDSHLKNVNLQTERLHLNFNHLVNPQLPSKLNQLHLVDNPLKGVLGLQEVSRSIYTSFNTLDKLSMFRDILFYSIEIQDVKDIVKNDLTELKYELIHPELMAYSLKTKLDSSLREHDEKPKRKI